MRKSRKILTDSRPYSNTEGIRKEIGVVRTGDRVLMDKSGHLDMKDMWYWKRVIAR
jgi:hypothetical protein